MICNLYRLIFLGLFVVLQSPSLMAQGTTSNFGSEFGGFVGTLLPNQIPGVTEILPCWGARFSVPISDARVEATFRDSHAKGVDFDVMSLSLRFDMNTVEGFTNIFYGGFDMNAYRPTYRSDRIWTGGGHIGSGLLMHVASSFWLRTDLAFAVSPGTSLFLGIGFVIRAPGGN